MRWKQFLDFQFGHFRFLFQWFIFLTVNLSGAISITVTGSSLAPEFDLSPLCRIGGSGMESSVWAASTALACKTTLGYGSQRLWVASLWRAVVPSISRLLTFDNSGLTLSNWKNTNGPTSGATSVTLVAASCWIDSSFRTRTGGSATSVARWISLTTLKTKLARAVLDRLSLTGSVQRAKLSHSNILSFDGVNLGLSSVSPGNSPTTVTQFPSF